MNNDQVIKMLSVRAADARGIILPFVISHAVILAVLGFGGSGLEDSGVQLALAAMSVLGSLWSVMWLDDCMQDLMAGGKDMGEDFQSTNMGKRLVNAPFGIVRLVNVVVVGLIVTAELIAIY